MARCAACTACCVCPARRSVCECSDQSAALLENFATPRAVVSDAFCGWLSDAYAAASCRKNVVSADAVSVRTISSPVATASFQSFVVSSTSHFMRMRSGSPGFSCTAWRMMGLASSALPVRAISSVISRASVAFLGSAASNRVHVSTALSAFPASLYACARMRSAGRLRGSSSITREVTAMIESAGCFITRYAFARHTRPIVEFGYCSIACFACCAASCAFPAASETSQARSASSCLRASLSELATALAASPSLAASATGSGCVMLASRVSTMRVSRRYPFAVRVTVPSRNSSARSVCASSRAVTGSGTVSHRKPDAVRLAHMVSLGIT